MTTKKDKDLNLVDGLFHDIAEDEAHRGKLNANDHEALREIEDAATEAARRARQQLLEQARQERLAAGQPSVPARILAMTKDAIVARLRELDQLFPGKLAVQHRKLEEETVDDLRTLLADLEAQIGPNGGDSSREP